MVNDNKAEIMTLKELAEYLKVAEKTIYRLVNENKIPAFKVGGSWRFRKAEIDNWIDKYQSSKGEDQSDDGGNED